EVLALPDDVTTAQQWVGYIHPGDWAGYRDALAAHLKGETARFAHEYRYRGTDGRWHWARHHGIALRDEAGRAHHLIGGVGDITEIRERERDLRAALDFQSASDEVLKAISSSGGANIDALLNMLVRTAARICEADHAAITRFAGRARAAATVGYSAEFIDYVR